MNSDDLQLLKKIAERDSGAFEVLLNKYQNLIYGFCYKMLKDRQRAEDVTQETWLKVVLNAESFRPTGSVRSWILSIARNLVIDDFRSRKRWTDISEEAWASIDDPQQNIEKLFSDHESNELLNQAFAELPENQKVVLTMVLVEELSQSEVAAKLGTSVGAVKATLFRARENLRKSIEEKGS